jgi:hypothetical protein
MRRLPLALALLLLAPAVVAQVYKWTDARGTVHYSETPPPQGTPFKRISTAGAEQPSPPVATATTAATPSPARPATSDNGELPNTPENRAKVCTSLKTNLDLLKGKDAVVMEQGGKTVALDDSQRAQQVALAEKQYQQFCSQ